MFFTLILCGLGATLVMSLVLYTVNTFGLANGDMHRAIGSLVTRTVEQSFWMGTMIHLTAGIAFAFVYHLIVGAAPINTDDLQVVFACLGISFFHGLVVSMLLVITVAEHHPLERFRKAGPGVVITYLLAHLVYGASLGSLFYILVPGQQAVMN